MDHFNLGDEHHRHDRYPEAIESFKQAIQINPKFAEAHFNLGFAYYQLERYSEAIESHKQAIRLNPEFAKAHYGLVKCST